MQAILCDPLVSQKVLNFQAVMVGNTQSSIIIPRTLKWRSRLGKVTGYVVTIKDIVLLNLIVVSSFIPVIVVITIKVRVATRSLNHVM